MLACFLTFLFVPFTCSFACLLVPPASLSTTRPQDQKHDQEGIISTINTKKNSQETTPHPHTHPQNKQRQESEQQCGSLKAVRTKTLVLEDQITRGVGSRLCLLNIFDEQLDAGRAQGEQAGARLFQWINSKISLLQSKQDS